jgi:hypothetical protein
MIFTVESDLYSGVQSMPWLKQKPMGTLGQLGGQHVAGRPRISMQPTSWSQCLLHVALGSVPAKKAREPPK